MIAARLATLRLGDNQHAQRCAPSQESAATLLRVSRRLVQDARIVIERGTAEMGRLVDSGELAVSKAAAELKKTRGTLERVRQKEKQLKERETDEANRLQDLCDGSVLADTRDRAIVEEFASADDAAATFLVDAREPLAAWFQARRGNGTARAAAERTSSSAFT